ncbi:hypothetical protein WDW37_02520 [Bdellovibrionota bacterium FG-1]
MLGRSRLILFLIGVISFSCLTFLPRGWGSTSPTAPRLRCTSDGKGPASAFALTDLGSPSPKTDLDATLQGGIEQDAVTTRFCASNATDNKYCFTFLSDDLGQINAHKARSIHGLLSYFNSESPLKQTECVMMECRIQ